MKNFLSIILLLTIASPAFAGYVDTEWSIGIRKFTRGGISSVVAKATDSYLPYGKLELALFDSAPYLPQLTILSTGLVDQEGSRTIKGETKESYNSYNIYLPLGFNIPFFSYDAKIVINFDYDEGYSKFKANENFSISGKDFLIGDQFLSQLESITYRVGLTTPSAGAGNLLTKSSFGIFYKEYSTPRTTKAGVEVFAPKATLINSRAKYAGIYYELNTETLVPNLYVDVKMLIGYGDISTKSRNTIDVDLDSLNQLLGIDIDMAAKYLYPFTDYFSLGATIGFQYAGLTQMLNSPSPKKYTLNLGGDVTYYLALGFIFSF